MSSASGLDKSLMLLQYPARMAVPVVLLLVNRISRSTALRADLRKRLSSKLLGAVQRLNAMAGAIGDARTMMRLFGELRRKNRRRLEAYELKTSCPSLGLIPILAALKRILLGSAPAFDTTDSAISTLQLITLFCYYPLENLSYLSSKGAIGLSKAREGRWSLWSVRFWAAYVMLDLWALKRRRDGLIVREKAARLEGEDLNESEKGKSTLKSDWEQWTEEVMVNV
jgi:hypothetical protein